jgi:hypothetical protein
MGRGARTVTSEARRLSEMMSILTLALMVLLVATMRPVGGPRPKKKPPPASRGDTLILGRGVKVGPPIPDPEKPGVVSYRLMKEKRLPSRAQQALRRAFRPVNRVLGAVYNRFTPVRSQRRVIDKRRGYGQSVELQNFLEARNRELTRRKGDDPEKRSPDETLH